MKKYLLVLVVVCINLLECKSQTFTCAGVTHIKASDFIVDEHYQKQFLKSLLKLSLIDTTKCVLMGYVYNSPNINSDSIESALINIGLIAVSNIRDTSRTITFEEGNYDIKLNPGNIKLLIKHISPKIDIATSFILKQNMIYTLNIIVYPNSTYKLVPVESFKISDILKD